MLDINVLRTLTTEAPWREGHAASDDYLGLGMLYYAIAYMLRAHVCVCLGSGGAFVPRCMRQAQRDLGLVDSRTIIVDANNGRWGEPKWLPQDSYFRQHFPDVENWIMTTRDAAARLTETLDFVHIDADHSYNHVKEDFVLYSSHLSCGGVITLHDTRTECGVPIFVRELYAMPEWDVVNFKSLGVGLALVRRREA